MIWVGGKILDDDALAISVFDRTFEHGLGLFESFRTWGGRPTLLDRHKSRMLRSAEELKIPIDPASLPKMDDVSRLLEAEGHGGDRKLRITASGGSDTGKSVVWMRSIPPLGRKRSLAAVVCVNAWSLPPSGQHEPYPTGGVEGGGRDHAPDDFTARHKTLNYWFKRAAHEHARDRGYHETLIQIDPWGLAEGSRSNLFLVIDDELVTLSTDAPIVPGIMRGLILELAGECPLKAREVRSLNLDDLRSATEIFLTNAVRGIFPVARVDGLPDSIERPAPGPWTSLLQFVLAKRLWPDRGTTL